MCNYANDDVKNVDDPNMNDEDDARIVMQIEAYAFVIDKSLTFLFIKVEH